MAAAVVVVAEAVDMVVVSSVIHISLHELNVQVSFSDHFLSTVRP